MVMVSLLSCLSPLLVVVVEGRGLKGPRDTDLGRSISFREDRSGHYQSSAGFSKSRISVKECILSHAKSRLTSVVVDGDLGPLHLAQHTCRCPCISVVPEAMHEVSHGPLKSTKSF